MGRRVPDRYSNLYRLIEENRCRKIMEVGTWEGVHAIGMIKNAQKNFPGSEVEYYGFDLFELMDDKLMKEEYAKKPPSLRDVENKLKKTGAKIKLEKGNTKLTLSKCVKKLPEMDFIFIDGGHSIETIENDWNYSRKLMNKKTVVVFDDYFWNDEPEVRNVGCQHLIKMLNRNEYKVEFLPPVCKYKKSWGTLKTQMVKVMLKS